MGLYGVHGKGNCPTTSFSLGNKDRQLTAGRQPTCLETCSRTANGEIVSKQRATSC